MVIPHWIRFARGAITGCLALSYRVIVGVYYSIVSKVCQPFFGVFDLLYYTAYDHHYSVWFVTVSHYNTTSITTVCHYSVSLQRNHYGCGSLQRIRLHYSVCLLDLISLCVFWVVPRSPSSSPHFPLFLLLYFLSIKIARRRLLYCVRLV